MKTPHVQEIETRVLNKFPGARAGAWACRRIAGLTIWSQHSWTEEDEGYFGNASDIFPKSMAQGDQIAAYLRTQPNVKVVLWRVKNHFDHVHYDTWPTGIGLPPCKGGALRVKFPDGSIGRTFAVAPPPPSIDEDMYAPVKQGDTGVAVEAWQRLLQQISGFKPPAWGVFGPETTAELEKLTGPGNNIGPSEGAALFALLGKK